MGTSAEAGAVLVAAHPFDREPALAPGRFTRRFAHDTDLCRLAHRFELFNRTRPSPGSPRPPAGDRGRRLPPPRAPRRVEDPCSRSRHDERAVVEHLRSTRPVYLVRIDESTEKLALDTGAGRTALESARVDAYPCARSRGAVQRSGRPPARAGADLPAFLAVRGRVDEVVRPGSFAAARAGDVPVVLVRDEEGTSARVPQRLQAPRLARLHRLGRAKVAPVPVPRPDVRARRHAAEGARLGARGVSARDGRGSASCSPARDVGPFAFVNPDSEATTRGVSSATSLRESHAGIDVDALCFLERSSPRPARTGRSAPRTTSSATTARRRTRGSRRCRRRLAGELPGGRRLAHVAGRPGAFEPRGAYRPAGRWSADSSTSSS